VKPYYQDNAVTIYHGDCREILPQLDPVDLVLTDPPYGINANVKTHSTRRNCQRIFKGIKHINKDWDDIFGDNEPFNPSVFLSFPEICFFGANHFADKLPVSACWIIWDKRDGGPSDDNADCEIAWSNFKGPARLYRQMWRGWLRAGVENISISGGKMHPLQKPIGLMKFCINLSKTTGLILDPFMGSGTTLRAAKDLGRKAIGIEIEEKYCEIAAKRMAQEVLAL